MVQGVAIGIFCRPARQALVRGFAGHFLPIFIDFLKVKNVKSNCKKSKVKCKRKSKKKLYILLESEIVKMNNQETLEQKKIQVLYDLMEEMKKQNRDIEVSALRWAIYQLEREFN